MCTEEIGGFFDVIYHQLLALRVLCAGCYRISIVLAFLCGLKKTIRIRYEWTRIFWTTEGKNSPSSKISQYVCNGPKIVKISCLFFVSSFRSFQRPLQISLRFHMLQLRFHTPEAWKWYPFRLEPPRMGHYRDTPPTGENSQEIFTELTTCRELWKCAQLWVHALTSVSQFLVKSTLIQLTIRRADKVNYYIDCRLFLCTRALVRFLIHQRLVCETARPQFPWRILY